MCKNGGKWDYFWNSLFGLSESVINVVIVIIVWRV